ncbi:MDR family MFS transporter [Streptomyces sp. BE308]|uniref:MDR family MFS transporter n=1 Tax=Streptomyces sp. BE308 TaxID=3002529 RepID=UPI002E773050|nr:MDR family MFS transporter [Streptomyces sp. BE308]MEE1790018.1 MDR family MFS transporter [Streptomyces sp. BE308]
MAESVAAPEDPKYPELTQRTITLVVTGLLLAVFMSALDGMIMATAMRTVADNLHGQTLQAWATTGYLITATISLPLYGKLSDIFGRKRLYMIAIVLFLLGSLLCAMAQSMYELALYRGIQGLGGGGLGSVALAVLADMLPPEQRVRYQANFGAVFGVASVLGPAVGGLFAGLDSFLGIAGWRWIFLINLPIGLITLVVVGKLFTFRNVRIPQRVDYWGATALVAGLVPLLLVAEQGKQWGWTSPLSMGLFVLGAVGLAWFLLVERRMGDAALMPPRLFRNSAFTRVNVVNFIGGIGAFTSMTFLPLYLQIVQGLSPTTAGLLLLPQSLATTVGAKFAGPIVARTERYKFMLAGGLAMLSATYLVLSTVGVDTSLWVMGALAVAMGLGLGIFMQTVLTALQNSVPPRDMGVASGLYSFSRQLGAISGTAVFLSVMFGIAAGRIIDSFASVRNTPELRAAMNDPAVLSSATDQKVLTGLLDGTEGIDLDNTAVLDTLDPRIARPILEGMGSSINTVFLVLGGLGLLAVLVSLTIREKAGSKAPAEESDGAGERLAAAE